MHPDDLKKTCESVIKPMFMKLGTDQPNVRISFVTFDDGLHIVFLRTEHTPTIQKIKLRDRPLTSRTRYMQF